MPVKMENIEVVLRGHGNRSGGIFTEICRDV
jgi:hypothetical protein